MPIAIFYHCRVFGGTPPIEPEHATTIVASQMEALNQSGLLEAADYFHIGVNGETENLAIVSTLAPAKADIHHYGPKGRSELTTLSDLRRWLPTHPGWHVCYFHSKGAGHAKSGEFFAHRWRLCMQKHVVDDWRKCVMDLGQGYESVGAHWLAPEVFGASLGPTRTPYWGGNFWWAKSDFLVNIPPIPDNAGPFTGGHDDDRFMAEKWIGLGRRPRVKDYAPHWPSAQSCFQ